MPCGFTPSLDEGAVTPLPSGTLSILAVFLTGWARVTQELRNVLKHAGTGHLNDGADHRVVQSQAASPSIASSVLHRTIQR